MSTTEEIPELWEDEYEEEYDPETAYGRAGLYEIPDRVLFVIDRCNKVLGCDIQLEVMPLVDYEGYPIAWGKGFTITDCEASLLEGPHYDFNREALCILKEFGFKVERVRHSSVDYPGCDVYKYTDVFYTPSLNYLMDE